MLVLVVSPALGPLTSDHSHPDPPPLWGYY